MRRLSASQVISLLAGLGSDITLSGSPVSLSLTPNGFNLHCQEGTVAITMIEKGGAS